MWLRTVLYGVLLLLVAAYVGWPYYTLYRINAALDAGDRAALDSLVDWQALREGLRSEVAAIHAPPAAGGAAAGDSSALAALIAPKVNELLVDAYASPQGLARLIRENRVEATAPPPAPRAPAAADDDVEFTPALIRALAFARDKLVEAKTLVGHTYESLRAEYDYVFFTDPVTFRVEYAAASPAKVAPLVLVLRLGNGGWRLTAVTLPRAGG